MSNILVIADQPRTQEIATSALIGTQATVKLVGSLKDTEEVPSDFPAALLIQDRLSGLSSEILARHLRTIFPGEAISFILLTDESGPAGKMRFIDGCVDLRRTDAEVVETIREMITSLRQEDPAAADAPPAPTADTLARAVEDQLRISGNQQPQKELPVASSFSNSFECALSGQSHIPLPLAEQEQELVNRQRQVAEGLLNSHPKRQFGWLYLFIPIALSTALYFIAGSKGAPTKTGAATPVIAPKPTAKSLPVIVKLPTFVPLKGLDAGYAKKHPGWERYTDSSQEYKVYRKGAVILALQIIDHSSKGLSSTLIERALQETTRNRSYTIASSSAKEGFLVEKGTAAGDAKIILYKRQSDRQIRGMVLHFD